MDKNIKAELSALRNEVLANLKNLEQLVVSIDTKLIEAEEVAVVARSPGLTELLNQCRKVKWSTDANQYDVYAFKSAVERVTKLWTVSEVERSERAFNDLVALLKLIEERVPSNPITNAYEAYWESISPGITEKVQETVEVADQPANATSDDASTSKMLKIDPVSFEVVDQNAGAAANDIIDATKKMYAYLSTPGGITGKNDISEAPPWAKNPQTAEQQILLEDAPEWAKNSDKKTSTQIWKEAGVWDQDAQLLFGRMWNNTAKRRIELLEESFGDVVEEVKRYNYYNERVTIKSHADAKALVDRYAALEDAKSKITDLLLNFDRATLDSIKQDQANLENFVRYYEWHGRLLAAIESLAKENDQCAQVARSCFNVLNFYMKPNEMKIWDPLEIDPKTFTVKPANIPADKLESYRNKAYAEYMKDLKRAYDWIKQREGVAA